MPDPIQTMIATNTEVLRLWGKLPPAADNRDVQARLDGAGRGNAGELAPASQSALDELPMLPRVAQARARYAGEAEINAAIHNHPRANDALDTLLADMNGAVNAEEGEEQEEADRLIVLPKRGGDVDPDDAVEHAERWSDCE